jgi:septal ring factor EnvC (AmiA/AmiB activator)
MSDLELRNLTPKMRGLVREISDGDVAHYPRVLVAAAELAAVEEDMAKRRDTMNGIETQIKRVESSIAELTEQFDAIDGVRGSLALEIFQGTRSDDEDRQSQNECKDIKRRLDQLQLVLASFRGQYELVHHDASRPSRGTTYTDAYQKLEAARFDAKVALANEKANA